MSGSALTRRRHICGARKVHRRAMEGHGRSALVRRREWKAPRKVVEVHEGDRGEMARLRVARVGALRAVDAAAADALGVEHLLQQVEKLGVAPGR